MMLNCLERIKCKAQYNYMQWIEYILKGRIISANEKDKGYDYTIKYNKDQLYYGDEIHRI